MREQDQAPVEQPAPKDQPAPSPDVPGGSAAPLGGHTVGPDYPGVTGDPSQGTRDMDRVAEEGLDDEDDES